MLRYTLWLMRSISPPNLRVVPPVMRRALYVWVGVSVCCAVAAIAWLILRKPLGVPRGFAYRFGSLILGLTPLLVLTPLWLLRTRHIRRALLESAGRLCTHCAYNVSTLEPAGTCPECGKPYDIEKDKPLWEAVGARYEDDRDTKAR